MSQPYAAHPSAEALVATARYAIDKDKPIMMDFWNPVGQGTAFVGIKTTEEEDHTGRPVATVTKILVKNAQEYTSTVIRALKVGDSAIIETENSIYVVPATVASKTIK